MHKFYLTHLQIEKNDLDFTSYNSACSSVSKLPQINNRPFHFDCKERWKKKIYQRCCFVLVRNNKKETLCHGVMVSKRVLLDQL